MDGAIRNPRPINKDTSTHPAAHGMRGTAVALPSSRVIILTGSGDANNNPINPARSSVAPITLKIFLFVIILLTERQGSGDGPRAIRYTIVACEGDRIATACGP